MTAAEVLATALVVTVFQGADVLWKSAGWRELLFPDRIGASVAVLTLPLGFFAAGLFPGYGMGPVERIRRSVLTSAFITIVLVGADLLVLDGKGSRAGLLPMLLSAALLHPALDYAHRRCLHNRGWWGRPVAILGANAAGLRVMRTLQEEPMLGYMPVGFLDDRAEKTSGRREPVPLLGRIEDAKRLSQAVKVVIVVLQRVSVIRLNQIVKALPQVDVIIVPDLHGFQSLWITAHDIGGVLGLRVKRNLLLWQSQAFKRLLDLTLGIVLFLCSLPVLALCAIGIKLIGTGPVFFRHERVGKNGDTFSMLKLRTMHLDAEARLERHLEDNPQARSEWERFMKLRDDPRILPGIGRLIRKFSLDELPQLWHVVCGQMSLVGPRPFPQYHVNRFGREFQELRTGVRPGLTGLWQVVARNNGDLNVQEALDTYYIRNWSLWLDLYVLLRTTQAVVSSRGAF